MQSRESETGIKVFISYTHTDRDLRKKLEEHLSPLKRSGKVSIWQDQEIPAGADWENQINTHLNEADLILLLISASFINSNYCWNKEVEIALLRHERGEARVVPILLKSALWDVTPLGQFQALPTGAKPVVQWDDQDAAFDNVVRGIRKVVEDLQIGSREEARRKEKVINKVAPQRASRLVASPESETVVSTSTNKETIPSQPILQTADDVVSHQNLASVLRSSPQDPSRNVSSSFLQKHRLKFAQLKRRHIALIFLILMLIGAGSLGIYVAQRQPTPRKSNQASATALANASATALADASATALVNASATAQANASATAQANADSLRRTWHSRTSGTSAYLDGVVWSGSQFVAVGYNGAILTSPDGVTWTPRTSGVWQNFLGVGWSGSQFVALGVDGMVVTSPDGITWTSRSPTSKLLFRMVWLGSQFVAVGAVGMIATSPDGITWTSRTSGTSQILCGVVWSRSQFVAVGYNGTILTSPDGVTWASRTSGTSQNLYYIARSGTQFAAVGPRGSILISPDGITWTPCISGTSQNLSHVDWSGTQFVAVGGGGKILVWP